MTTKTTKVETWDELDGKPGAYMLTETESGKKGFIITCPLCGAYASSSNGHTIQQEDPLTVSPSFVCPHKPCTAHYYVKNGEIQFL